MPTVSMTVNGKPVSGEVEARTLLVQFLRDQLRLTGTHVGCDTSQCGACVVHIDGESAKSCTMLALQAEDVYDLVVDASEFGTAGTFVVVLFGLFTRFGGARSALGALLIGLGVWLYGKHFTEWTCSYLVSLAAAALMYVLIAIAEGGSPVQASGGHESPVS